MRDLAEQDPDALVILDLPGETIEDDDLDVDVVAVRRSYPPFVVLETERRR